ncbi:UDP-N-acetylmuramoyl-tripeptide--D-alanyl-D-alanine ligase [Novosphingobium sp. P6W]|uniref:UDP-N-acetylmuramoyl-tripeptide--D-alanyl-D- alanine ligase n=1 Tax=Novosphingobium sp. P6W TaxID=1609758 RepID=UPI0005C318B5|nr:UDP-N-acetylmuramoyl-tripeptide--D-alanyl-D-alanine ligase [Novosphingobium sp. P6W]AXB77450.1 UDP-N-acetylmuramoyl-tripeptide--D-alanyl-D-alanine ligase [Novosphingobium sp. P6W]KIS33820.1 UDP-N-acetylmuramoylalanyl-D-glutamyl-2, 6-diaminopimelate--D-alanyl-D-alanine ligase [Novosphingobium sp. P6W]
MVAVARILDWPLDAAEDNLHVLWDAGAIARAVKGEVHGAPGGEFTVSGVEIDSRDVQPGDLFFALKGEAMDGHRFVEMAFAKGAAAVVVDRPVDGPHILVADTMEALERLGAAARLRARGPVIGVTGSVGKTGVKEMIFAALDRSSRGDAHRSVKSYNNHVGVPLSLARMPGRSRFGVFEMGMNHAGEISALTRQVRPHVAVITTIAPAHIEMLGSEEAIADAKAEIFQGLEEGGTAVIPIDSPHYARLREGALACGATVVSFGKAADADVRLLDTVPAIGGGSLVTVDMGDRRVCYTVAAPGEHQVINSLAVMAAVRAVKGDLGAAGVALAEMGGMPGRGARVEIDVEGGEPDARGQRKALLIDESYNANPASMRATLAQLGRTPARRRIAVLGAMKELGSHGPDYHAALAEPIREAGVDYALLVGEEMAALAKVLGAAELGKSGASDLGKTAPFAHCPSVREAVETLRAFGLQRDDAILVKGSNSVGLSALVTALSKQEG